MPHAIVTTGMGRRVAVTQGNDMLYEGCGCSLLHTNWALFLTIYKVEK